LSAQLDANVSSRAFDDFVLNLGEERDAAVEQIFALCHTQAVAELNAAPVDDQEQRSNFSSSSKKGASSRGGGGRGAPLPAPVQEGGGAGVLGMSWSCNGSVLAAAYGRSDHVGWCTHASACVAFWNIMRRQLQPTNPDFTLELDVCPTALAYHPERATILAAGMFNGEIRVWDTALLDQEGDDAAASGSGGAAAAAAGGADAGNPLLMRSGIDDFFHREPISRLQWIRDPTSSRHGGGGGAGGVGGGWSLVSVAGDGKVLFWSVDGDNKLRWPTGGFMLTPNAEWHGRGANRKGFGIMGGTAVAFVEAAATTDSGAGGATSSSSSSSSGAGGSSHYFVAATEGGGIVRVALPLSRPKGGGGPDASGLRWHRDAHRLVENADAGARFELRKAIERASKSAGLSEVTLESIFSVARPPPAQLYPSAVNKAFEGHAGPAYGLAFNPFDKRVFASAATDGRAKLFHISQTKPLLTLEALGGGGGGGTGSNTYLYSLAWSPARPLLLAVGTSDGRALLYDLQGSMLTPSLVVQANADRTPLHCVAFNRLEPGLLATADTKGRVSVFQLSDKYSQLQPGEKRLIQQMGALSANA
jgi:WD40 repeat protein